MPVDKPAFQDQLPGNHCFGCGKDNPTGLQIKSYWLEDGKVSECRFQPAPGHCAGPAAYLNGGVLATVVDCHAVCTAMAAAYIAVGRPLGSLPPIPYVTASLHVDYRKPARIAQPLLLQATVAAVEGKKTWLQVIVSSGGDSCATAEVLAVRVSADWGG